MSQGMTRQQAVLTWLLRSLGVVDLLAVLIVFLPVESILAAQRFSGLDVMSDSPLLEYLIRTSSALYALHGVLILSMSQDVARYEPLIRVLGWLAIVHGGLSVSIDSLVGMPVWWICLEGPTFAAAGLAILWLMNGRDATRTSWPDR